MPGIDFTGAYNPYDKEEFAQGDEERIQRHTAISLYWKYYGGDHKKWLKVTAGNYDDNVVVNMCSQAVERLAAFIFPEVPLLKYSAKKYQKAVDSIWAEQEYIPSFCTDSGIAGLIAGHMYARIDASKPKEPHFLLLDPRLITNFWDRSRPQETLWYRMTWADHVNPQQQGQIFYIEDYVPSYLDPYAVDYFGNSTTTGWQIIMYRWNPNAQTFLKEISREHWVHDVGPIVDWKAQPLPFENYGPSLLRHLHINDVANFLFSNTNRILRFHAHPKTIILGASKDELQQTAIDQVWAIPVTGAQVFNLEMQSELQASMLMFERAKEAFFGQTHVVDTNAHKDRIGQITNFGLHVLFSDMLDHTSQIQQLYGRGIQELIYRAMTIMGHEKAGHPQILWPDALPVNRSEHVNSVRVEQSIGVTSPQTLAETLDRDFEREQERLKTAKKQALINLAEEGIHDVDDLPLEQDSGDSSEQEEMSADDRLQRTIESV